MPVDHSKDIITLSGVSFAYTDKRVIRDINLSVHQGDYLGVIGPNGSGKSTILKIMLGLLTPQTGEVKLFGKPINEFREWGRIGYVPQRASGYESGFPATVLEVVAMGRVAKSGLFKSLTTEDIEASKVALEKVEMKEFENHLISQLSGGQQQRVFIARALSSNPDVIFLDEPLVGVDAGAEEKFYKLLSKMNKELDITLVMVSHDIGVVANEATEIACINHTLVYHGTPSGFMHKGNLRKLYGAGAQLAWHHHKH